MSNWEIITSDLDAPRSIIEGDDNHIILTERGGNIIDVDISN